MNRLLKALSHSDRALLQGSLRPITFEAGQVLNRPGDEVERIYFPHAGMISMFTVMRDGKAIETATIGQEGALGTMAGFGVHVTLTHSVVRQQQHQLTASQINAVSFRHAIQQSNSLRNMMVRYNDSLLGQIQITSACNALHLIGPRLARSVLQISERLNHPVVPFTHEMLSEMLGVRRTSITEAARKLQAMGGIRYNRGNIEIVNRKVLEANTCECYETLKHHANRLWRHQGR